MHSSIRHAIVRLLTQVELSAHPQPRVHRERPEQDMQLTLQVAMLARGSGIHMQHTLPHLIEEVLAQPTTPLDQRLELGRLRIAHQRGHAPKRTPGTVLTTRVAHDSSIRPSDSR